MSRHDTFRSFRDLDAARFRNAGNGPERDAPAGKRATAVPAPVPAVEDEAAMFLEAVSGTLDVTLKHTSGDADTPVPHAEKRKKQPAAPPAHCENTPARPETITAPELKKSPEPLKQADTDLFAAAMGGVTPIRAGGREFAPPSSPPEAPHAGARADMEAFFNGKYEFSLEYTDEFVRGHVLGLDPLVLEKLKSGAYSPEGHVDLHGQNMEQAYATLAAFVRHAYQSGKRHLVVVTGRGKNSPGGMPVLRERVQTWLTRDPFKRVVLGFCSAKPGDGGAGALYVLLRRRKKSQGKIVWNLAPSEEELLL